jgi:hypothetical protein
MSYLLHCICSQDMDEPPPELGLRVVTGYGLAAVVLEVEAPTTAPSLASLLEYEKVVEAIHARQTVIPLRYGCMMESEERIVRLLEDQRQIYEALLGRLQGMTEMGIRVLSPAGAASRLSLPLSAGTAYLASLRHRYDSKDTLTPEEEMLADRIAALLARFSTEQRREVSWSGRERLLSICLLTPKTCIEEFRKTAREISLPKGMKFLLSGPWPPYNFVVP